MSKDGKQLYHLTALANLESIFQNGLQPKMFAGDAHV